MLTKNIIFSLLYISFFLYLPLLHVAFHYWVHSCCCYLYIQFVAHVMIIRFSFKNNKRFWRKRRKKLLLCAEKLVLFFVELKERGRRSFWIFRRIFIDLFILINILRFFCWIRLVWIVLKLFVWYNIKI